MTREELKTVLKLARVGLEVENEKLDTEARKIENITKRIGTDLLEQWIKDGYSRSQALKDSERILTNFYQQKVLRYSDD